MTFRTLENTYSEFYVSTLIKCNLKSSSEIVLTNKSWLSLVKRSLLSLMKSYDERTLNKFFTLMVMLFSLESYTFLYHSTIHVQASLLSTFQLTFILNLTVVDTIFKTVESKHLFQRKNSNDLLNLANVQTQYFHMPVTLLEVSQAE